MAYSHIHAGKDSFLGLGRVEAIALNSFACESGMLLKFTLSGSDNFINKAWAWDTIIWISSTEKTFAANNETVGKGKVNYVPRTELDTFHLEGVGQTIVFAGDFITGNTINLKVNGTAMTQVAFATTNAAMLTAIVLQLNTQFSTLATFTESGAHTILIVPVGNQASVVITNIVIAGWTSQTTATYALLTLTVGDRHKFYDITAAQYVDFTTESSSTWQLLLEDALSSEYSIANA